jgi:signal transduction histidine kinase
LRLTALACGLATGVCAAYFVPRGLFGAAGAMKLGVALARAGYAASVLLALVGHREAGSAPAAALAMCCAGLAVATALLVSLIAWPIEQRRQAGRGVDGAGAGLRAQLARACGGLALAAWALASGHVLGQRHTDAARNAADEARDLVSIAAEHRLLTAGLVSIDTLAANLAPAGGYLVDVDDNGRVLGGVGVGVAVGESLNATEGPPALCRTGRRTLPCAVRRVIPGPLGGAQGGLRSPRLVAAVPAREVTGAEVLAFAIAGLVVAFGALGIGALAGSSTARDLDRVSQAIDDLKRSTKGLSAGLDMQHPIVAASPDEVGDLAAALGELRRKLRPVIDEYKLALEKSQAADDARDELLARVSVALRTPLNQVIAAGEALLDLRSDPLSAEQRDDVKTVLSASRHLIDLIDEVLDVSAIATGQVVLRLGDVDLGALVADVAKTQRPIVQKKGVEVKVKVCSPSPLIRGDEARLRQVLTNIVSNAVKFTEKGSIDIAVEQSGGVASVHVADTGPGIPAEALPKLFREFVQLGSLKQRAHGTGLGLAICKRLVEAHGGDVGAESVLGQGSIFYIKVPVAGPAPSSSPLDDTPVQGVEATS